MLTVNDLVLTQYLYKLLTLFKNINSASQFKWAPQARGPLCFAHVAQSIATPLIVARTAITDGLTEVALYGHFSTSISRLQFNQNTNLLTVACLTCTAYPASVLLERKQSKPMIRPEGASMTETLYRRVPGGPYVI